jgi:glutathione synthase/RimK-type ligase-like ATP-grasp enzyme
MQHPADIAVMCDKAACQERLKRAGVRVPETLGVVKNFDELTERMDEAGKDRIFLKLCHGSSASGAVALERSAGKMQAFTTAKMSGRGRHGVVLHNSRTVIRHHDEREIGKLVDAVCRHRAAAEVWIPKAGWGGRRFDVRVVVVGGRASHVVARLAKGPFTTLQLGAERASAEELAAFLGAAAYGAILEEAERAMACFPRSLHGGVDVLLDAQKGQAYVIEVNAFGDLLPSVLHQGKSTYEREVEVMMQRSKLGECVQEGHRQTPDQAPND